MDSSWFSPNPLTVFIDNSCFYANHYNLLHPVFQTLREAVIKGRVKVIHTPILKGEFIKHATEKLIEEKGKLTCIRAYSCAAIDELDAINEKIKNFKPIDLWDKFVTDFQSQEVIATIDWQIVFEEYFAGQAPFQNKDKKNEFPDAFNIKLLESLRDTNLAIWSNDGDFDQWVGGRERTVIFKNIKDFSDKYLKLFEPIDKSEQAFNSMLPQITERLSEDFSDGSNYTVDCYHSEITGASVEDLELIEAKIVRFDDDEKTAEFSTRFEGLAKIDLSCPVISWDSIDKHEVWHGTNRKQATIEIEVSATIKVFFLDEELEHPDFEIEDSELKAESFLVPNEWTEQLDYNPDDDE